MLGQRQQQPNANPPPQSPPHTHISPPPPPHTHIPPPHTHIPPPPPPFNNIPYHQPPSPPHNQIFQPPPPPPPQFSTTDIESPLASHLQLAPWLTNYRATSSPEYHGNTNPHKFLMWYEATIASAGGNEATLAQSYIISLKVATTN
jgi:hypothetical protein